jgi:hypothetical protein
MHTFDTPTRSQQASSVRFPASRSDLTVPSRHTIPSELSHLASGVGHDFARIRVHPGCGPSPGVSIPVLGQEEEEIEAPDAGVGPVLRPAPSPAPPILGPAPSPTPGARSCSAPMSMTKVTSGAFQGGFSLDDYYPDLVGKGYWSGGATAGTFDTGSRVGAKVQLFGTILSPCDPSKFSLAQSVTRTRDRFNGVTDPTEGQTLDDIAKSGRDASTAPFRRDWLSGGNNISMADPPSVAYKASTNAEWDRDYVTSLIGPAGRESVTWSVSIRITNGSVKKKTVS